MDITSVQGYQKLKCSIIILIPIEGDYWLNQSDFTLISQIFGGYCILKTPVLLIRKDDPRVLLPSASNVCTNDFTNEKHKVYNSMVHTISIEVGYYATNFGSLCNHFVDMGYPVET